MVSNSKSLMMVNRRLTMVTMYGQLIMVGSWLIKWVNGSELKVCEELTLLHLAVEPRLDCQMKPPQDGLHLISCWPTSTQMAIHSRYPSTPVTLPMLWIHIELTWSIDGEDVDCLTRRLRPVFDALSLCTWAAWDHA